MADWFTADTHFGHKRTMELSKRPFEFIEEMDFTMIRNWNRTVKDDDRVFHLGDFGNYEVSKQLKGKIVLLYGNYERKDVEDGIVSKEALQNDYNFHAVDDYDSSILSTPEAQFRMIHEPSKIDKNYFNLFGHIHKLQMVKRNGLNVGVDCHNFTPIDMETVMFYKNAIENHYDEDVFC